MTFSPSTLALFQHLLDQLSIRANAPDFDELCAQVSLARYELTEAQKAAQGE